MTAVADYINRRFDLLALRGAEPVGVTLLQQTLFDAASSGAICAGVQKLAQRWTLEFLTIKGSMPFLKSRGCDFLQRLRRGQLRTELDVIQAFLLCSVPITTNLRAEEPADMDTDERFDRADLVELTLAPAVMTLRVDVYSRAGNARAVLLPVETVPIKTTA